MGIHDGGRRSHVDNPTDTAKNAVYLCVFCGEIGFYDGKSSTECNEVKLVVLKGRYVATID